MMRWIVGSSLQLRLLVVAIAAVTMVAGITQLRNMPVDILPEFAPPYVEIQTEALGLSAAEVEALITVPLEADMLNGVSWVKEIRSESIPGLSSIILIFERGTDIMAARQMVQERLIAVHALPNVSKPPAMLQPLSSTSRVLQVGLSSKDVSLIEMSVLARWTIKPRLMGVPGVANVSIWGQRERELQVLVDPETLRDKGVTLNQVIKTTGNALWVSPLSFLNASTPGTGGWIDTPNQRLGVRHILPISTPEHLAQVTVDGTSMRLGDVAEVVENHPLLIGDAIVDDVPSLLLVIEKFPWANTLEVTRGVEAALEALQPGLTGIEMDPTIYRPATFIEMAVDNLTTALLIGLVLAILVLFALLYHWRVALISLVAILLSLLAGGLVLYVRGANVDMMVLAGFVVALGIIVDDAIIDIENIARRLRQQREQGNNRPAARIILEASLEMRSAILYATVIVLLVVVPIFVMQDFSGAILRPLALSYVLAIAASMLVALTVTPALSMLLLRGVPSERRASPLAGWLRRGYDAVVSRTVHKPRPILIGVGAVVALGLAVLPFLGKELFPPLKEYDLLVRWEGTPGASRPAMNRIAMQASRELRSIPGVRNVSAHAGRAVMSDEVASINAGELWVSIDPAADYDATVAAVRETVAGYPGLSRSVLTYTQEKVREVLAGADEDIVVRLYGEDLEVLRGKAQEVGEVLSKIDGVVDLQVEPRVEEPQVEIEVDLAAAQRHGIKPGDVRRAAAILLSGINVGSLFEEQKVFDVVVWGKPDQRHSPSNIRTLLIDKPGGGHVRLDEVADVRIAPSPNVIKRESVARRIDVGVNVQGRDLGSVAREVQSALAGIEFPLEYRAELLGEYAERQAAQNRIFSFAIAALIGIFLILQAAFRSWRLAALVFLTLPAALVGGVLAALAAGGTLSLGALVGFLAVFGIAARNGITLIKRFRELEQSEGESFGPALVQRGTRERLAPIVTTAAVTAVALLPLLFFGALPGFEIVYPMAVVILGGLVTATLYSLFGVPALYSLFGGSREADLGIASLAHVGDGGVLQGLTTRDAV